MHKSQLIIIPLIAIISSCSNQGLQIIPTSTSTQTVTLQLLPTTKKPIITQTINEIKEPSPEIHSINPTPLILENPTNEVETPEIIETDLKTMGPYLSYFKAMENSTYLIKIDQDGGGRQVIDLGSQVYTNEMYITHYSADGHWVTYTEVNNETDDSYIYWQLVNLDTFTKLRLSRYSIIANYIWPTFSKNNQWIVFHKIAYEENEQIKQIKLELFNLPNFTIVKEINLLPRNYPNNFEELANKLSNTPGSEGVNPDSLRESFFNGITITDWSPDGKNLAFSGALDGPSTDVYVLNMDGFTINRMTNGLENVYDLYWLNDRYIVNAGSFESYCLGPCGNYYLSEYISGKATAIHNYNRCSNSSAYIGKISEFVQLYYCSDNGGGQHNLHSRNLLTDTDKLIFPSGIDAIAMDPYSKELLIASFGIAGELGDMESGLYLVNPINGNTRRVNIACSDTEGIDPFQLGVVHFSKYQYYFSCASGVYLINIDGTAMKLTEGKGNIYSSPEQDQLLIQDRISGKVYILLNDKGLEEFHELPEITTVSWRPDKAGAFILADTELYYLDYRTKSVERVDSDVIFIGEWMK